MRTTLPSTSVKLKLRDEQSREYSVHLLLVEDNSRYIEGIGSSGTTVRYPKLGHVSPNELAVIGVEYVDDESDEHMELTTSVQFADMKTELNRLAKEVSRGFDSIISVCPENRETLMTMLVALIDVDR